MEGKLLKGLFPLKFKINLDRGLVCLMEKFHEPATFLPKSKQIKINHRGRHNNSTENCAKMSKPHAFLWTLHDD